MPVSTSLSVITIVSCFDFPNVNKKFTGKVMVNENTKTAKITDSLRPNLCGTLAYKDLMIKGTEKITVKRNVIFK